MVGLVILLIVTVFWFQLQVQFQISENERQVAHEQANAVEANAVRAEAEAAQQASEQQSQINRVQALQAQALIQCDINAECSLTLALAAYDLASKIPNYLFYLQHPE